MQSVVECFSGICGSVEGMLHDLDGRATAVAHHSFWQPIVRTSTGGDVMINLDRDDGEPTPGTPAAYERVTGYRRWEDRPLLCRWGAV